MNIGKRVLLASMVVLLISSVFAITASIGNARAVVRAEVGDTLERTILVKNVNDESVKISMGTSGDLASHLTLSESEFELAPGAEKKVAFTVKIPDVGTTETKIDVQFAPLEGGNAVGLSSTLIVIAEEGDNPSFFDGFFGNDESPEETSTGVKVGGGNPVTRAAQGSFDALDFFVFFTGIVLVVLFTLVFYYHKKKKAVQNTKPKKNVRRHA